MTLLASRLPQAQCRLHITNADGSVPEMCGNGLRCVARALIEAGDLKLGQHTIIDTDAGPLGVRGEGTAIIAEVGPATLGPAGEPIDVQLPPSLQARGPTLQGASHAVTGQRVSVGNPHFILDAWAADADTGAALGPLLERHASFPERTNVEFVEVRDDIVHLVVWERGVGLTQACGTGACATVASLAAAGKVPSDTFVPVQLPGGRLEVSVSTRTEGAPRVTMRGPANVVFRGTVAPTLR